MKMNPLLKKIYLEKKDFVTSEELKKYCNILEVDYDNAVRNLLSGGYLLRIFKGIFYVYGLDEIKLGGMKYSYLELVAEGLLLKNIRNWYFGLYTALKLNNITHEEFAVEHVINDVLFRAKPMEIAGHKFKFYRINPILIKQGIIKKGKIRYSDPEKTIVDFIYLWRYNSIPEERIIMDIADYTANISKSKIRNYAKLYPKSVTNILERLL
jgi:predicted transcriptional regulator of viral defense system